MRHGGKSRLSKVRYGSDSDRLSSSVERPVLDGIKTSLAIRLTSRTHLPPYRAWAAAQALACLPGAQERQGLREARGLGVFQRRGAVVDADP